MHLMSTEISIVLPTYNEAENIPIIIEKIRSTLESYNISFEVIVSDDNSPDGTWRIVESLSIKYPFLRVLRRLENKGLSPAVVDGFHSATGKYLIVMDADMQHDETILPKFLEKFKNGASIVVGSRKSDGGGIDGWSKRRQFISWGATMLARLFGFNNSSDPMSGYFGITREFFHDVVEEINPRGFKILLEFLAKAPAGKVEEIGFKFQPRQYGESKLTGSIMLQYVLGLYDIRFGKLIPLRFINYALVGFSGVFINQMGLLLGIETFKFSHEISLIFGIELSILSNFLLNNYFTFRDRRKKTVKGLANGLLLFHLVSALGAVINYAVAILFSEKSGWSIYLSNLLGIAIATIWNFVLNLHWTWAENRNNGQSKER